MNEYMISPIEPSILKKTTQVAQKAFGYGVKLVIPQKNIWGFYAHHGDTVVGAVYLKKTAPNEGILDWIFVDPEVHGHQLGKRLADAGFKAMDDSGLTRQFALVRDDNTASWNMFAKQGYVQVSVFKSLFGYHPKSFFNRFMYSMPSGYSTWVKDASLSSPSMHPRRFPILKSLLLALFIGAALSLFSLRGIEFFFTALIAVPAVTLLRILVAYPVARRYGPVRFDAPQGGTSLAVLLALIGTWWPTFGMFVPADDYWKDRDYQPTMAWTNFVSWMSLVAVFVAASLFLPDLFNRGINFYLAFILAVQMFPFFPLDGMDGYSVLAHSKGLYLVGLILSLVSLIVFY